MKKIMICGAGGSPATNFVRSVRAMSEETFLVGVDSDPFTLQRAETDVKLLVPRANDKDYLNILNQIIEEYGVEFIHAQNDTELEFISNNRDAIKAKVFLPKKQTVDICVDKFASYDKWKKAGIKVPETIFIHTEADLKLAFGKVGPRVWLRNIKGAAGNGAFPTSDYEEALEWINREKGWGHFTAAECLTKDTVTWMSIWKEGKLIVAQTRKRLSWELANRSPSGVTGVTGTGQTYSNPIVDDISIKTILAVDPMPDGIFSVDCTYDSNGVPNPTEINIGRFFTTHFFFTKAGLNMPEIYIKTAYGETPAVPEKNINPLKDDLLWIRGVDFEPVITDMETVQKSIDDLKRRLSSV